MGRIFVPEVVQTSALDCGPACLKSVLEAVGIPVNYDRLRQACQTSLDGTSINTLEEVANELGVDAEQVMVPVDHLLVPEARIGPAVVVVKLPNAFTHFVVLWNRLGGLIQMMDPAVGRVWPGTRAFLDQVYVHQHPVPAEGWREWAESAEFRGALAHRARRIGVRPSAIKSLLGTACADRTWRSLALLDAAVRMTTAMAQSGGVGGSRTVSALVRQFFERASSKGRNALQVIPPSYWSVLPIPPDETGEERLLFHGAVALRIRPRPKPAKQFSFGVLPLTDEASANGSHGGEEKASSFAREMSTPAASPLRQILRTMRADGWISPAAIVAGLGLSTCGVLFEVLLYRAFVDLGGYLTTAQQKQTAVAIFAGFFVVLLVLDLFITKGILRLGRNLEIRLRTQILQKLPRLADHYLSSRLISDLAERAHAIQEIRGVPNIGIQFSARVFELVLTTAGVVWLDPRTLWPAIACAGFGIVLPFLIQPLAAERDLRFRTHTGALCRFYFDALRGLVPVWTHRADNALRTEHESLLVNWLRAGFSMQRISVALGGISGLLCFGLTLWLLMTHFRGGDVSVSLLLVYWALNLPAVGGQVGSIAMQYPRQRNLMLRVLEPLNAPEANSEEARAVASAASAAPVLHVEGGHISQTAAAISLQGVTIGASGHNILEDCNLDIPAGSHVCIVGPSGAGKSSLVGILLGWHRPKAGQVLVDGEPLTEARLEILRRQTVWLDPNVQIWNRSLLQNLQYGGDNGDSLRRVSDVLARADLTPIVKRLPKGLQSTLGEGGALVSGGEGQRIRLGRAMLKRSPRLAILDEPFSALDRERRREFLMEVRELWRETTLLCITHDIRESLEFERVVVVDGGRIVETGAPQELLKKPGSRYQQLLEADELADRTVWSRLNWRRIRLERGQVLEGTRPRYDEKVRSGSKATRIVAQSPFFQLDQRRNK